MSEPTGRKVFRVYIARTMECDLLIEADSKDDVIAAVGADDIEQYNYDCNDDVTAYEVPPDKLAKTGKVLHGVLDGEVCEIADADYQAVFGPKAVPLPPPPDTVTLPLFPEERK